MNRTRNLPALAATLCIAMMLGACGKKDKPGAEDSLLVYVPSDTPYVIANTEPLPKDVVERMYPAMTEAIESYRSVLKEVINLAAEKDGGAEQSDVLERASSVVDQLLELATPEGMEAAGITRESAVAIYGNGLLPVIRIEVTSGDAFDAAVGRIEESAGAAMKVAAPAARPPIMTLRLDRLASSTSWNGRLPDRLVISSSTAMDDSLDRWLEIRRATRRHTVTRY